MKKTALLFSVISLILMASASAFAGTLEDVKAKGILTCGISEGVPGFSIPDSTGTWVGFDVDMARAVAAAVLADPSKVKFVPLASKQKIVAVSSGQVDLTSRTTTWTLKRDGKQGVDFTHVVFYDGQGFLIPNKLGVRSARELDGASVCVTAGTTTELNLADFARANGIKVEAVVFDGKKEALNAYASGRCDCFTTDISQLASLRSTLKDPKAHSILPEVISKEPLAPLVRHGDNQWKDIVTWVINGLVAAEENGITAANVDKIMATSQNPVVRRMLGTSGDTGSYLGLDKEWLVRAIKAVGNYGEIYDRHFGPGTALDIPRGVNNLWLRGGLQYAMPIR
ncbi:amino acid ABC transporter substrate-binding protein [Desulfoluna spongiiphila]|uniref:Amino acid ABC transporter substrate-binding protein, PAAT family n=1 Tax=Desulfoluna spongiiphila TaxID=419481 RepID=A0A1G5H1R6_9BACT|nr:amino acid ABC transporter substrate-binding protein [Desulfoluna spongiiphila]SCY57499.1 amino acid ABC transporter substrate-binding protein, PAAT family [Desulfoluna spongiiphila]VVS94714.1 solute-binding protein family 3 conserved site [Desulfoluna spongiiphila]